MYPDSVPPDSPSALHEVSRIETPEQIVLELPLAGVGSRALSYFIDFLWQLVPIAAAAFLAYELLPVDARPSPAFEEDPATGVRLPLLALAFVNAVVFLVNFGYFAVFEVIWRGQSPGKRTVGLRVVRDGGYPIDGRAALVRNLLRVVDFLPALYFLGIASLFTGRKGKRIGDYAAGTIVVKERRPEPGTPRPLARAGSGGPLSPAERSLVEEFLARRSGLSPDARARVGRGLADRLAGRLGRSSPSEPERFLEDLLLDASR